MAIISVHGILNNGYLAGIGGSGSGANSVTAEKEINEIEQYGVLTFFFFRLYFFLRLKTPTLKSVS